MRWLSKGRDCFLANEIQHCVVVVLYLVLVLTDSVNSAVYTNQIAVHIEGGPEAAHRIAKRHGFINLGQIGAIEDHYLFEHPHIVKRSASLSHEHHEKLNGEPQVRWLEQQAVLSRKKRGFTEAPYSMVDPNWGDQWYLHREQHMDMNVIPAWQKGYTGKGVVITILDDGIERNHADLQENYDPQASYDINARDSDPMPRYDATNENRHGTRCAGEVSATANNSVCGVGVAFKSSIGGVRMLDGDVTDAVEAASLSLNPQHIDIYSASWGPDDDGRVVDGPGKLAKQAFINGITKGRNGLGSIFVWASGNGGNSHDSCNCDGYTNSVFTLSVSSTSESGTKPWYLEECSSTLATTYSSGGYRERQIVTTDLHNLCTKTHTGTSAAAPLAAGIVALVLEANPKLTWRDVQYITMLTARTEPFVDADWSVNSLGRKVSLKYGYGLMDTSAMVDLAENWNNVPEQHTCEKVANTTDVPLTGSPYSTTIDTDGCSGQPNAIKFLEHVQINVTLSYSRRGDISLHLISPRGTTSTLLPKRQNDRNIGKFDNWPFMSVHFWGEDPTGTWQLEVRNEGILSNHGMLSAWSLRLHGTAIDPVSNSSVMVPGSTPNKQSTTTAPVITCHSECAETCKGPKAEDCDSCKNYRLETSGPCVSSCPDKHYPVEGNKTCYKCDSTCQTCDGPNVTQCQSCFGGWFLMTENNTCVMECADGYFEEDPSGRCSNCDPGCYTCEGTANTCTSCHEGHVLKDGACALNTGCHDNEFKNQRGVCEPCHIVCGTCHGPLMTDCLTCVADDSLTTYLQENTCVTECSEHYYLSHLNSVHAGSCIRCHQSCKSCEGPGLEECTSCENGLSLVDGQCTSTTPKPCSPGQHAVAGQCVNCHMSCQSCDGSGHTDCLSCPLGSEFHSGECVSSCSPGMYPTFTMRPDGMKVLSTCLECHVTCASCTGGTEAECITCRPPLQVQGGLCKRALCQKSEYIDLDQHSCQPCHPSCDSCKGPEATHCLSCSFSYLLDGSCQSNCPPRFYPSPDNTCLPCHDTCKSCTGPSTGQCRECMVGYVKGSSGCVQPCDHGQFFDQSSGKCRACFSGCASCTGADPTDCLSCSSPLLFESSSNRCLPCCANSSQIACCYCGSDGMSSLADKGHCTLSVSIESGRSPEDVIAKKVEPQVDSGFLGVVLALCFIPVVFSCLVFIILQLRSNNKLCWRHRYSKVPLTFDPLAEKLSFAGTTLGDEEEGEDEELFNGRPTDPNHNMRAQQNQY